MCGIAWKGQIVIPDVHFEPRVDANAVVVIAAADHVAQLLPVRGFTVGSRLDPLTFEQMKALMKAAI